MFASPPIDSQPLRIRDLRGSLPSPRTTVVLRSKQSHPFTSPARTLDVFSIFLFPEKSGNMKLVGFEPMTYLLLAI